MIPRCSTLWAVMRRKPRASGDDPQFYEAELTKRE